MSSAAHTAHGLQNAARTRVCVCIRVHVLGAQAQCSSPIRVHLRRNVPRVTKERRDVWHPVSRAVAEAMSDHAWLAEARAADRRPARARHGREAWGSRSTCSRACWALFPAEP